VEPPSPSLHGTLTGTVATCVRERSVKSCRLIDTSLEKARTARSLGTRWK
jgi:hypothetical protein